MPRQANAKNCSTYKWHIKGELNGETINKKYCSINIFVDDYGGDKTPLNLNKSKVLRLKQKWDNGKKVLGKQHQSDEQYSKMWNLSFTPINEKRKIGYIN